jgi:hypothetical protein
MPNIFLPTSCQFNLCNRPSLTRPANTLYRHNLTATLETAIRSSNAQNDTSDVLRRLDARMLEYSHGEIGWDVFTLEYKVDAPIDTVLDPESMEKYLKLFRHLWQMKRIEGVLNKGWMRIAGGARTFLRVPGKSSSPMYQPSTTLTLQNSIPSGIKSELLWQK